MLEHWVKCYKDPAGKARPADEGEYHFAKYNKKVRINPTAYLFREASDLHDHNELYARREVIMRLSEG